MPIETISVGFLPRDFSLTAPGLRFENRAKIEEAIRSVRESGRELGGWYYPDLESSGSGDRDVVIPAEAFQLPGTHVAEIDVVSGDEWMAPFLVQIIGFCQGIRLMPSNWWHFYRAAVVHSKLSDFRMCDERTTASIYESARKFWLQRDVEDRLVMYGAVHWYLFSQSYTHDFERFGAQCAVTDACFRVFTKRPMRRATSMPYATRIAAMCESAGIPVPTWAQERNDKTTIVSTLRNAFFHEARFAGHPIGFAYPKDEPDLVVQLQALNSRLILTLLGVEASYIRSDSQTGHMHGLHL